MARPRIVHVYKDVYPPVEGGVERAIHHLARLTSKDFEPSVITAVARAGLGHRRVIANSIEVAEIASLGRALSTPIAPGFIGALRAARADLFHFHFPHPTGEVAYLLSGLPTPAVVTYHSDVVRQRVAKRVYGPFMRRFLSRMRVIMPTSERYLATSETLAPHADRCRVVPLGMPLEDYEPTPETEEMSKEFRERWGDYILFLGCLRTYKGLPFLIEAMKQVPDARLVVAGEGRERENLIQLSRAAGLADRIEFLGRVDHPTAVALLRSAAIFCLPAHQRSEAFGLCQIEAMACSLPVISTDLPTGVPEVNRDGETGLIVPPADAEALGGALKLLLGDPALRNRFGKDGELRARQNYTARRMADAVSEIYEEVLQGEK